MGLCLRDENLRKLHGLREGATVREIEAANAALVSHFRRERGRQATGHAFGAVMAGAPAASAAGAGRAAARRRQHRRPGARNVASTSAPQQDWPAQAAPFGPSPYDGGPHPATPGGNWTAEGLAAHLRAPSLDALAGHLARCVGGWSTPAGSNLSASELRTRIASCPRDLSHGDPGWLPDYTSAEEAAARSIGGPEYDPNRPPTARELAAPSPPLHNGRIVHRNPLLP